MDIRTAAHGDADVCPPEGRGVVDTVPGHGHHPTQPLAGLNNLKWSSGLHKVFIRPTGGHIE